MLSTSGILGYGFPEESLTLGMERGIHMLGVDGGSTDPGPHYLGSGKTLNSARRTRRPFAGPMPTAAWPACPAARRPIPTPSTAPSALSR